MIGSEKTELFFVFIDQAQKKINQKEIIDFKREKEKYDVK